MKKKIAILLPDFNSPLMGGSNFIYNFLRSKLAPFTLNILLNFLSFLEKKYSQNFYLIANNYVASVLQFRKYKGIVYNYEKGIFRSVEFYDYKDLHYLADCIDSKTLKSLKIPYLNASISKITEIRWLVPLTFNLATAKSIIEYARENDADLYVPLFHSISGYLNYFSENKVLVFNPFNIFGIFYDFFINFKFAKSILKIDPISKNRIYDSDSFYNFNISANDRNILVVLNFDRTAERFLLFAPSLRMMGFKIITIISDGIKLEKNIRDISDQCICIDNFYIRFNPFDHIKKIFISFKVIVKYLNIAIKSSNPIFKVSLPIICSYSLAEYHRITLISSMIYKLVSFYKPIIALNFEDWEINRLTTLMCNERNIPTLAYYCLSPNAYSGLVRRTQKWLATSGEILFNSFKNQFHKNNVRIIGDPLIVNQFCINRHKYAAFLPEKKILILILLTYPHAGFNLNALKNYLRRSIAIHRSIPNSELVFKLHPRQGRGDIDFWLKEFDFTPKYVFQNENLLDIARLCNIAIVPRTTAAYQIMLAKVPVISPIPKIFFEDLDFIGFDYLKSKGVVQIEQEELDSDIATSLIFNKEKRNLQIQKGLLHGEEHFGKLDTDPIFHLNEYIKYITGN